MNFLWPWLLLLFLIIPFFVGFYLWILRRRRRFAIRYSTLALIREALPKHNRWRQHLPFVLFLLGLALLTTAFARPVVEVEVPLSQTTIVLALDVSRSMCATDVEPNRLTVAQDAALAFIEDQAGETKIGIVAFARFAEIIVSPTNDRELLQNAIRNLTTSFGTAIGSATLKSIDAIAEINAEVTPSGRKLGGEDNVNDLNVGGYLPDIIVLLTDGANTSGTFPIDAAQEAAERKVRVFTIGFGSTEFSEMVCTQEQLGSDVFGGGFGGGSGSSFGGFGGGFGGGRDGFRRYLFLDEPTLKAVADKTGGSYFRAENSDQLLDIFLNLPNRITLQTEKLEVSVIFSAFGALLLTGALSLSLLWNRLL